MMRTIIHRVCNRDWKRGNLCVIIRVATGVREITNVWVAMFMIIRRKKTHEIQANEKSKKEHIGMV